MVQIHLKFLLKMTAVGATVVWVENNLTFWTIINIGSTIILWWSLFSNKVVWGQTSFYLLLLSPALVWAWPACPSPPWWPGPGSCPGTGSLAGSSGTSLQSRSAASSRAHQLHGIRRLSLPGSCVGPENEADPSPKTGYQGEVLRALNVVCSVLT